MKTYFLLILLAVLSFNCSKNSNPAPINPPTATLPIVTTNSTVTIYNVTSASSGGTVVSDGGASISARGVCWSTNSNPTIADNVYNSGLGFGTGTFSASMNNLTPGATYFVKAFATNSVGTAYGTAVMFTVTTPGPPASDLYATGILNNGTYTAPTLWKNGIPSPLTTGAVPAEAYSVFVSPANDVYVSGYERNGAIDMARIWKNGVGTFLTTGNNGGGKGWSVYASGSDVYVAGESNGATNTMATLWRNGVANYLSAGTSAAKAYSVCVSGGEAFVAGYEGNMARVWRNGVPTSLTNATNAVAYWVTVFLPNVYAAGSEMVGTKTVAKVWKDAIGTSLTNGNFDAVAFSIYINYNLGTGTDVYVVGYENNGTKNVAKIWKNGVATSLTDGTKDARACSVHGVGTDIYVGGYENDGTKNVAKLWKNGLEIPLQNSANAGFIAGTFAK